MEAVLADRLTLKTFCAKMIAQLQTQYVCGLYQEAAVKFQKRR